MRNVTKPSWPWVGTGPPGSLELSTGRVLVPAYHSTTRGNILNNIAHGHVLLSDDGGVSWRLGNHGNDFFGSGDKYTNEDQAVELRNGSVLINARSLANPGINQQRIQARSDDGGETFAVTSYAAELPQPVNGCEGSIVKHPNGCAPIGSGLLVHCRRYCVRDGLALQTSRCARDECVRAYMSFEEACCIVLEVSYAVSFSCIILSFDLFLYRHSLCLWAEFQAASHQHDPLGEHRRRYFLAIIAGD